MILAVPVCRYVKKAKETDVMEFIIRKKYVNLPCIFALVFDEENYDKGCS